MERTEKALKLPAEQFKRNIGTTKPVFQQMVTVLQSAYETLHNAGGKCCAAALKSLIEDGLVSENRQLPRDSLRSRNEGQNFTDALTRETIDRQ